MDVNKVVLRKRLSTTLPVSSCLPLSSSSVEMTASYSYTDVSSNAWSLFIAVTPPFTPILDKGLAGKPDVSLHYTKNPPGGRLCGLVVRVPGYRSSGPGFDFQRYQILWQVVGLDRGPLSLVSTTEELLGKKSSGSGLENRDYGRRGSATLTTRHPLYPQKLALTSPTSGARSVGKGRSRNKATEWFFLILETTRFPCRTRPIW
jgi:hypothetical protein